MGGREGGRGGRGGRGGTEQVNKISSHKWMWFGCVLAKSAYPLLLVSVFCFVDSEDEHSCLHSNTDVPGLIQRPTGEGRTA